MKTYSLSTHVAGTEFSVQEESSPLQHTANGILTRASLGLPKPLFLTITTLLLLLTTTLGLFAQTKPDFNTSGQYVAKMPLLSASQIPPYRTDMPLDVLIGYIVLDSITKSLSMDEFVRRRDNIPAYDDTVKQALKYNYIMKDYNPVTFFQWMASSQKVPIQPDRATTERIVTDLFYTYIKALPSDNKVLRRKLLLLLNSDMIAHVKVNSTSIKYDSVGKFHDLMVTSEIVESIKGKAVPSCISNNVSQAGVSLVTPNYWHSADSGACVQWGYRLEWCNRFNVDTVLANQWVQPNKEYIVFNSYVGIVDRNNIDSLSTYLEPYPYTAGGKGLGMYPIVDGKVLHSAEDFGTNTNMTVAEFKAMLREQIYNITHP